VLPGDKPTGIAGIADRMFVWIAVMFMAADQFFAAWFRGWIYVWADGELPSPDETLSSWIGRNAVEGHRAALIAEAVVDFFLGAGHCRKAIGK
jgi:hypothetical protein